MTNTSTDTKTKPDPTLSSDPFAKSNMPTASGAWSCGVAQGMFRQYKKSDDQALGTPAFVTRTARPLMDAKDLEKLVKSMLTPFTSEKFDTIKKVSPDSLDIERIQYSASVAHMLTKVSSHFTSYDLGLAFTKFPVVDFSTSVPTWDLTTTINLFESYDQITPDVAAKTVAFMRECMLDDELPKELTWTHEFLLSCCESASGENSLSRIVRGETDSIRSSHDLKFGGPLTLILILKHISSSSDKAIENLKTSIPKVTISTIPGENIDQLCNALSYVLRRLDTSVMPNLSIDLLKVMQTTSYPAFNKVFESWQSFVLLKIAPTPTWDSIFSRAREVYEQNADTWTSDDTNNGDAAFKAGTGFGSSSTLACHGCGKKGFTTRTCPDCNKSKSANGGGEDWKKSPWYIFPNESKGDVCTTTTEGTKCWSKKISGKDVKWCGKCFSTKYKRKGMWTSSSTNLHFTHQHDAIFPDGGTQANLATDRTPVEEHSPEASESNSGVRAGTSFSDALQQAAEGN